MSSLFNRFIPSKILICLLIKLFFLKGYTLFNYKHLFKTSVALIKLYKKAGLLIKLHFLQFLF